jgi:GNAT superfamily N-acetyltransferase
MGYLTGCISTVESENLLVNAGQKVVAEFSDLYKKYPAHLHVDVHPDFQGHGVGSFLLQEFMVELRNLNVKGVHILTAAADQSVAFYLKNNFHYQVVRSFNGREILFMGRLV